MTRPRHKLAPAARHGAALALLATLSIPDHPARAQGNQPPSVQFLVAPAEAETVYYGVPFAWQGSDLDGSVPLYRFAIDPPQAGTPWWIETDRTMQMLVFRCGAPEAPLPPSGPVRFVEPHTLAVKAVDDLGLESGAVTRSFFTYTIAPEVRITSPPPSPLSYVPLDSNQVTLGWTGTDWDSWFSSRPVKYKYALFTHYSGMFPTVPDLIAFAWTNPDSFGKLAPATFAYWDSSGSDSTSKSYWNLVPGADYMFCVTAFDEAGAYSPRFVPAVNMIWVRVAAWVSVNDAVSPGALHMEPPRPNPARASAALRFALPRDGPVTLDVFDAGGRRVRTLATGVLRGGEHGIAWDLADTGGRRVGAGLYLVRIEGFGASLTRRILVLP